MSTFGITPQSEIWLLNVPELEPSYSNTYMFDNNLSQVRFFMSRKVGDTLTNYTYLRKGSSIKINKHIDDVHSINYIMYKNKHDKWYFAFIMDKIYINEMVTELVISIDLLQTYMFDYTLEESYIDRCHVDRWKDGMPTEEYEDEGLEFGEHIQTDSYVLHDYLDSYVAVCSNPLGVMENRGTSKEDNITPGGSGGDWQNGVISAYGYRFIKGFEGFSAKPYKESGDVWTVGYGTTKDYDKSAYDQLTKNPQGCTEEEAAKVFYERINKNYGKPIVNRMKVDLGITEQYQADALFSLAYNAGTDDILLDNDLMRVIKKNPKDEQAVCAVWHEYAIRKGSQFEQGLRARRKDECAIFFGKQPKVRAIQNRAGGTVTENNGNGWLPS